MDQIPNDLGPSHPGETLLKEFLLPRGITQKQLADAIHVPFQRVNELVNGKRGVTPSTSLRFSIFFQVPEDYWMVLQARWDLYRAKRKEWKVLQTIEPAKDRPTNE